MTTVTIACSPAHRSMIVVSNTDCPELCELPPVDWRATPADLAAKRRRNQLCEKMGAIARDNAT